MWRTGGAAVERAQRGDWSPQLTASGISIIIPTRNEELALPRLLENLRQLDAGEVIVVDGHSRDATRDLARRFARVFSAPPSRALQMNAGAAQACCPILLFLHADVTLSAAALPAIREVCADPRVAGGHLDLRYLGGDLAAWVFTQVNRIRSRMGIFYGDSGIFCRRELFHRLGGYPDQPVMEDYEFVRRLRRHGKIAHLSAPIFVSNRRWRRHGLIPTLWAWFWIQTLYSLGAPPQRLARWYRDAR